MKTSTLLAAALSGFALTAYAEVKIEPIEYKQGDDTLEGYLAYDDAVKGKRPGVLVVHQFLGVTNYEKNRARMLAKLGYTAFACDIYGKGSHPLPPKDAGEHMHTYITNRMLLRARAQTGLEVLKKHQTVDASRTAAIGYCSGGTAVLEMARANMDVLAVVSFHGQLFAQPGLEAKEKIKPIVLVCHGEADKGGPPERVAAFKKEFLEGNAKADLTFVSYPGVGHGFTIWKGSPADVAHAYDKHADEDSWKKMQELFVRVFK
jgi:dienelactone hydrolase